MLDKLLDLFTNCWKNRTQPEDFRDAVIVSLYKNKGEKSGCSAYRGIITLRSIADKVLARVLLNRLIPTTAQVHTPESQCGFRSNRGTTDMILVLRQIQEKCKEQNMGPYAAFVDLTKAFDTVSRDAWTVKNPGTPWLPPPPFLTILRQFHEGQQGQVKHNGSLSGSSSISDGAKQGCVLAPTLFSIFFGIMLREEKEDLPRGIYIRFRTDGSVFNLWRLARTKIIQELINELLIADDCALLAHTEIALQHIVTEVLYQPSPREAYSPPHISIDGTNLNAMEDFTYLGIIISNDATVSKDLDNCLSEASSSFGRL